MRNDHLLTINEILELTFKQGTPISNSDGELLPVFLQTGTRLGVAPRLLCHRLGLIHKVVYLFIRNTSGKILIQVRGDSGRIDIPVGGHVSIDDTSDKEALVREVLEELGIEINEDKLVYHSTYFREFEPNSRKPQEINRELRVLYSLVMDENDEKNLESRFGFREEKKAVIDVKWLTVEDVIKYCDASLAADGLRTSLPHYLMIC
jgi:8-oxo-dGTP pyrophosphatase MutT (NUDIX family)